MANDKELTTVALMVGFWVVLEVLFGGTGV
jgi:hypothetical protein